MDQPLTVVLPVHNCERQLRSSVLDILDLAQIPLRALKIVVVDDGSTDDTYETACELGRRFPQLTVLRQSVRQGMGAALELVRNRLAVEKVLMHDGVSAIDAAELQQILQIPRADSSRKSTESPARTFTESSGSRRFSAVRVLHNQMEQAHRSIASFHWVQLDKPLLPRRRPMVATPLPVPENVWSSGKVIPLTNLTVGIGIPAQA